MVEEGYVHDVIDGVTSVDCVTGVADDRSALAYGAMHIVLLLGRAVVHEM